MLSWTVLSSDKLSLSVSSPRRHLDVHPGAAIGSLFLFGRHYFGKVGDFTRCLRPKPVSTFPLSNHTITDRGEGLQKPMFPRIDQLVTPLSWVHIVFSISISLSDAHHHRGVPLSLRYEASAPDISPTGVFEPFTEHTREAVLSTTTQFTSLSTTHSSAQERPTATSTSAGLPTYNHTTRVCSAQPLTRK